MPATHRPVSRARTNPARTPIRTTENASRRTMPATSLRLAPRAIRIPISLAGGNFSLTVDNDLEPVYGAEGEDIRKRLVGRAHAFVREIGECLLQGETGCILFWRVSVCPPFRDHVVGTRNPHQTHEL